MKGRDFEEQVYEIIKNSSGMYDNVKDSSRLIEDLGMDELDREEMVMELEEIFGVIITDEQLGKLKTVKGVISLIKRLIKSRIPMSDFGW